MEEKGHIASSVVVEFDHLREQRRLATSSVVLTTSIGYQTIPGREGKERGREKGRERERERGREGGREGERGGGESGGHRERGNGRRYIENEKGERL